ncbi:MAG: UDP-glucose/GDP-mannose dehydrogenase family protein [Polyangiaceae bacterium]
MRIAVVGTGYVGLVTRAGLAEFGNDVACVCEDEDELARLADGKVGMYEPGLPELVATNLKSGRIRFTADLDGAVKEAEVIILATPIAMNADGDADLAPLFNLADRIGKVIDGYKVIALESTVPVGTTDRLAVRNGAHGSIPFGVASTPAIVKEGEALADFRKPDRVVVGTSDERAAETLRRLYEPLVQTPDKVLVVGTRSAELAKHAASAVLASRISFMNEVAGVAEELGADIEDVRLIIGTDPRIGPDTLRVGPGFGGVHFQRDLDMLLASARDAGRELAVVTAVREVNRRQKQVLLGKLDRSVGGLDGRAVAIWGLAFKPQTDDLGESPALELIEGLLERGAEVRAHDPKARANAEALFGQRVRFEDDMYAVAEGADVLVLCTAWPQYRRPDFSRLATAMLSRVVVDGRNIWDPSELRDLGFRYLGIGRP